MTPHTQDRLGACPLNRYRFVTAIALGVVFIFPTQALAERKPKTKAKPIATVKETKNKKGGKEQTFDFTGLSLSASVRTPQLLYFLDRASEELQRASLERRSFIPEMIRSISEEGL